MNYIKLFFSGLLFANGIPHFIQGISGKDFHNPYIHKFFHVIPSPTFNVIWGLLNFLISGILFFNSDRFRIGKTPNFFVFLFGFIFAAIGLSIFFRKT